MRLASLPLDQALGSILVHNISDAHGHKTLSKGRRLGEADLQRLRALGRETVFVGVLEPGDVREDVAAARLAQAVAGPNLKATSASGGRANLLSTASGVLYSSREALAGLNALRGVTVAAVPNYSVVRPKKMVATIKTIGLALPDAVVQAAESLAATHSPVLEIRPLTQKRIALLLTGESQAQARVEQVFLPALEGRVQDLGSTVVSRVYVSADEAAIAEALVQAAGAADCVILAGETSVMDWDDVTPRGIRQAGGEIEAFGAPVEPGNLLLLAYRGATPILGAPGCVKSRDTNVVDLLLPRLLVGERVTRDEVAALADGGLLL